MTVQTKGYTVYRLYDAERNLLYVGCTANVKRRFQHHSTQRAWWPDVAEVETETFASVSEAAEAERAYIVALDPRHNVAQTKTYAEKVRQYERSPRVKINVAKLRRLRQHALMTQIALCDASGVSRDTVSRLEKR
jgi:excinuclease UvrABC nuclease subunit